MTQLLIALVFLLNVVLLIIFICTHHFYPVLISLHIISLLALWILVIYKIRLMELILKRWKEIILIIFFVAIAFGVRMYRVEEITPGMYGDELTVGTNSLDLLKFPDWLPFDDNLSHRGYSHPTPLMYMTSGSILLFGHTLTAIRLPSIIFGSLAVGAFYILLRLFFPIEIAVCGTLLMVFQYTQVVLSRLAYEPPASLFFQTLSLIFLILYIKTKDKILIIGIALTIGAGLYTYLNFRPFAALLTIITIFYISKTQKLYWKTMLFLLGIIFIAAMPLLSYSIIDPQGFWSRSSEISIFSRHYSNIEFFKELGGNIYRTTLFPFIGDPNPDKNPSDATLFDFLTIILGIVGMIYLFRKKRPLFWLSTLLFIPPFVSDVFSTEVIPDFHYYGLGHPNALRVSSLIIVVLLLATFGIEWIYKLLKNLPRIERLSPIIIILTIITIWNWDLYFNQLDNNLEFYLYNYKYNEQRIMQLASYINQTNTKKLFINDSLQGERLTFFLNPNVHVSTFQPKEIKNAISTIKNSDITAIDVNKNTLPLLNELTITDNLIKLNYNVKDLKDPLNKPSIILFQKP